VLAALSGQESTNKLLSPEQFAFGGADFGRAYDASDLTGDSGVAGKLELRFSGQGIGFVRDYTVYAFYDRGCIHNNAAAASNDCADAAGLGTRFSASHGVSGYVEFANPINHDIPAEGDRKARVFAGLTVDF
jgi:hemolysin activation/secretion protein